MYISIYILAVLFGIAIGYGIGEIQRKMEE